jgi:ferritin-like metal-binding protein YciE
MTTIDEQLVEYLADAHSIEEQPPQRLRAAPEAAGDPELAAYELFGRVAERGSRAATTALSTRRAGALNWGTFFEAHPDTPGKLAAFAYAFEHLEIAG